MICPLAAPHVPSIHVGLPGRVHAPAATATVRGMGEATELSDPAAVEAFATRARGASHFGLDSESNSMYVHRERVCLVQLVAGEELALLDPFAFDEPARCLEPLREMLEDPELPVILHGGEYDVAVFKREFEISIRGVYDTQQAASYLGWKQTGLGALVKRVCDVELDKAYARYDWGTRPIESGALDYALDDVRYLEALAAHLKAAVEEADLEEEVALANGGVEAAAAHSQSFDPAGFWRIKGMRELDAASKARVEALYTWREAAASRADLPSGRLLNDQRLLALARRAPRDARALSKAGVPGRLRREEGDAIVAALATAGEAPKLPMPKPTPPDPELRRRENALKKWRRTEAEARGVDLQVVLPARALAWLAEDPNRDWNDAPMLGAKRRERYAEALRRCLEP